jgi:signal transduction histidine kinase
LDNILTVHPSLMAQHLITPELDPTLPKVLGDKDRLRQVMINLLTNATRYAPEGTSITVSADVVEEGGTPFVRVCVADEGIGIAEEDRDRIFTKFSMLPKPAWVKKGTGLGLFITRGIVETHGGRIWVESEAGSGSRFYFTLQVARDLAGA